MAEWQLVAAGMNIHAVAIIYWLINYKEPTNREFGLYERSVAETNRK